MDRKQIKTPQRGTEKARRVIGQRIKKRRKELGITQKELGRRISRAEVTVRQYESGILFPNLEARLLIATALDCEYEDLFDREIHIGRGEGPHRAAQTVIPTSYIRTLIVQPENAGDKSRVLSWLLRKWEEEQNDSD